MKPLYANFFGVSKTQNADGELVELTLNISHKYMEQQTTIGPNGVETISAPAMDPDFLTVQRSNRVSSHTQISRRDRQQNRYRAELTLQEYGTEE